MRALQYILLCTSIRLDEGYSLDKSCLAIHVSHKFEKGMR